MAKKKKNSDGINGWKPTKESQMIVAQDGKLFVCNFDKVFGYPNLEVYNRFIINRQAYKNQLPVIINYINYFINFYDTDHELVLGYLKVKYALDKNKEYNQDNMKAYIAFLYEVILTPTIVDKIIRLTEDNYHEDIEAESDDKKKYQKNKKKYLESLEFTNQHVKILLSISLAMRILCPVIFHYFSINNINAGKDDNELFDFYLGLFKLFGYGTTFELYDSDNNLLKSDIDRSVIDEALKNGEIYFDSTLNNREGYRIKDSNNYYALTRIDMYNKLFVYVKAKVLESYSNNSIIFDQREIMGKDIYWVINNFTKNMLVSSIIVKYKFGSKEEKTNIIGLNKTVLKYQLNYYLKEQYKKTMIEVTDTKNSDELSGADKMLMNLTKLDEGIMVYADINIDSTVNMIKKLIDIPISDDEVNYYMKHHVPSKIQIQLVYSYYTKYFHSYRDLNLLTRRDYITLLLLLKKKLLIELGYEEEDGTIHQAALPYILTGNLEDKLNTRIIRNNKFISKVEESYLYKNLVETKFFLLQQIKPDYVLSLLSSIINSKFTYIVYERPDLLGHEISYSEDKISDELLFFLNSI